MLLLFQIFINRALSIFKQTQVRLNTMWSLFDIMGRSEKKDIPQNKIDIVYCIWICKELNWHNP